VVIQRWRGDLKTGRANSPAGGVREQTATMSTVVEVSRKTMMYGTCEGSSDVFQMRMWGNARAPRKPVLSPLQARLESVPRLGDCAPHTGQPPPRLLRVRLGGFGRFCASPLQSSPKTALRVIPGNQLYGVIVDLF